MEKRTLKAKANPQTLYHLYQLADAYYTLKNGEFVEVEE